MYSGGMITNIVKYPRVEVRPTGKAGRDIISDVCNGLEREYSKAASDNFRKIAVRNLSYSSLRVLIRRTVRTIE